MEQLFTTFGVNWKLLVIQAVNFTVLLTALSYFLYRPLMKVLDDRKATIAKELKGERIDIVLWSENAKEFIAEALSPAEVEAIELDEETKQAKVRVAADQFSLAIGKAGQNVRLAARLTGWKIDVNGGEDKKEEVAEEISTENEVEPA
jgi:N utilization substance protein A